MAIAVIGGLLTSTALSLLVVPVVFTYVRGFEDFVVGVFKRSSKTYRDGYRGDVWVGEGGAHDREGDRGAPE